jgi:hypothetical protein
LLTLGLLLFAFTVCALAVDLPGDETTNKKQLALWQSDPVHIEKLRHNLAAFRGLSRDKQDVVRKLDKDLHDQDALERSRLRGIMERYAGWVARLSEDDRAELERAAPGLDRIRVVQKILDHQWQESLPRPDQEKLAKASPEERTKLLEQLRKEDEDRRKLRVLARRSAEEAAVLGPMGERRERFSAFLDESLRPLLSEADEKRLNNLVRTKQFFEVYNELAKAVDPLPFPGPVPPGAAKKKAVRSWDDLPADIAQKFPTPMPAEIVQAKGKWPDFALAIAKVAKEQHIDLPGRLLGPTRLEELPPSVRRFLDNVLILNLTDEEKQQLQAAEGEWPDYPKKIKELAGKHQLVVPGLSRPVFQDSPANKNKSTKGPAV